MMTATLGNSFATCSATLLAKFMYVPEIPNCSIDALHEGHWQKLALSQAVMLMNEICGFLRIFCLVHSPTQRANSSLVTKYARATGSTASGRLPPFSAYHSGCCWYSDAGMSSNA